MSVLRIHGAILTWNAENSYAVYYRTVLTLLYAHGTFAIFLFENGPKTATIKEYFNELKYESMREGLL